MRHCGVMFRQKVLQLEPPQQSKIRCGTDKHPSGTDYDVLESIKNYGQRLA